MPSADPPTGLEARRAALAMLDAVLRSGATLDSQAGRAARLPPADAALARAIAGEVLRRVPDLDSLIDGATRQRLPDDSKARMVLRMALAQALALGTPPHAVIATSLPLVAGGPRRLVHGVLGTLLRGQAQLPPDPQLPAEVERRWSEAWGDEAVAAARRAIARRAPLDLSFAADEDAARFAGATGSIQLAPRHCRLAAADAVAELPGFGEGRWWVQDLAASIPARLMPAATGRILDLCAAPGGKTMQLAAAGHSVTALDRSARRLERLAENLGRTQLTAELVEADALDWTVAERFDAVLLDAPCSATGTFRRHPEVLHRARPAVIAELAALQARMLDHAAGLVRPGGTLIYSVCSLEPDEGERQVEAILARQPGLTLEPIRPDELPAGIAPGASGMLRILPTMLEQHGGLDGFFVARLVRGAA